MDWIFSDQEICVNSLSLRVCVCAQHLHVCLVTLVRAISVSLSLISRLCACVAGYVQKGSDADKEAITLLLVILQKLHKTTTITVHTICSNTKL